MGNNLVEYQFKIKREQRQILNGHGSFLVLFTGLSGSGKSTLANALENHLYKQKMHVYVLDGDNIRKGINRNLGFSPEDRSENNRRVGEISKLFIDAGCIVLAAFVSPYIKDRENIKQTVGSDNFFEVFVNTDLAECERRDPKGLYKKARAGEVKNMTGISAPYEIPENPDLEITSNLSVEESVTLVLKCIKHKLKA
ncbi:adenylyl-sulfate kinase [uncultured Maribacter sp.]|uniref:adenylyl-sulfate kinase n=1 Tax=uncultured Maribacter sp. TaxID=431308 RepID=UPI0026376DF3|nr:adenylyl-sulfate kinase [uncultured Maribacter sp.]